MAIRRTSAATTINRSVTAAAVTPVNIITGSGGTGATVNISSIQIANSGFTALDDTAVSTAGGFIIINGTGFQSGASVRIQGTSATSVAFVSSSRLNVTVPAISSGTLDIYVINPDGSGAILISGFVSSGVPSWTTTSPLTGQDVDTAFSIQLAATGDGTVTYGVSSGSTLPSGTTLASNGRFSGTVTGIEQDTTYTFSVDAIDSQNQETVRSFNITVTAYDQYYYLTTLHLSGETPANTWVSDASANSFNITVVGDTRPMAFSPYETVWSNFFDGTGDYLSLGSSSAFGFGTSDFTVEFWVYLLTNSTTSPSYVLMLLPSTTYFAINMVAGSYIEAFLNAGTAAFTCTDVRPAQNAWSHIALVRSGTTVRLYVNGVASANTATNSSTLGSSTESFNISNGSCPASHISNLRITKSAVYTSNFTPSTTPLTAIANTTLLTCRSNTNIDLSNNNLAITVSGNSIPTLFSPFTPTYATKQTYSTSTLGGSMFFDGTGDYLTIGNNLSVGANNFTVQAWVHPTAWTVEYTSIISTRPTSSTGGFSNVFVLGVHNSGYPYIYSGDFQVTGTANTVPLRSWTHLCVTRSGSTMRLFVNGALANSRTSLQNYTTASGAVGSNGNGSEQWTGYLSDVTLTGGEAIYTSSFVPPLSTMTPANNTLLMLNGTDAVITDESGKNDIETIGDVRLNTSVKKYGNSSIYFDGTNDALKLPAAANVAFASTFRTGNFTIECWVNRTTSGSVTHFLDFRGPNNNDSNPVFYWQTNNFIYYTNNNSSGDNQIQTSNPITSSSGWVHLALVRSGTTLTVYVNGVASGSVTYSTNVLGGNPVTIGNRYTDSGAFAGYIDDFRITNGIARYTANFTPPGKLPLK